MVDLAAIGSAMSAFKAAKDIAQTMIGLRDAQIINTKVAELTGRLIEAQSFVLEVQQEHTALVQRIAELEREISELKIWDSEKEEYKIGRCGPGGVAYIPRDTVDGKRASHYLCANCYSDRKKSFLQLDAKWDFHCARCNTRIAAR